MLTASSINRHIENSKNDKKAILAIITRLSVNVLLNDITFLSLLLFSMCQFIHKAVNTNKLQFFSH